MLTPIVEPETAPVSLDFALVASGPAVDNDFPIRVDWTNQWFIPWDIEVARINFGANCGPASFAAVVGLEVCDALQYFPDFLDRRWCNFTHMKAALRSRGAPFAIVRSGMPQRGLALVQWLGPWIGSDFGGRKSLKYTHWIGVEGGRIFDHTEEEWMPLAVWKHKVARSFLQDIPGATGWAVRVGIEVMKSNNRFPSGAGCRASDSRMSADNLSEYLAML